MRKPYFKTIIETSPEHIYKPVGVKLHSLYDSQETSVLIRDYADLGDLTLVNLFNQKEETFTIWHDDTGYFYVCLPNGDYEEDGEEELEIVLLEDFNVHMDCEATTLIHL